MRLIGSEGFIELERSETGELGTPGAFDILLNVTVQAASYAAAGRSWVIADEWTGFLTALRKLDERRQGRAVVDAASRLHVTTSASNSIQPTRRDIWQ